MNDQQQMDNFVALSAILTGFNASILAPTIDPINIKADYFAKFTSEYPDLYMDLFTAFAKLKAEGDSDEQIGHTLLDNPQYEMPCRQLIFLWSVSYTHLTLPTTSRV